VFVLEADMNPDPVVRSDVIAGIEDHLGIPVIRTKSKPRFLHFAFSEAWWRGVHDPGYEVYCGKALDLSDRERLSRGRSFSELHQD